MRDMRQGSIAGHVMSVALPMAATSLTQTLLLLVDLFFISRQGGAETVAGVSAATSTVPLILAAVTEVLSVGTMSAIGQALGRGVQQEVTATANQALGLSLVMSVALLSVGAIVAPVYVHLLSANAASAHQGIVYLSACAAAYAVQFPTVALWAIEQAHGVLKPLIIVNTGAVLLNIVLAPVLVGGVGTGVPLGAAGAGLATSIASVAGFAYLALTFKANCPRVRLACADVCALRWSAARGVLAVGGPSGAQHLLGFFGLAVLNVSIAHYGPGAQAGYGTGTRVLQALEIPLLNFGYAVGPVVAQNVGAGQLPRAVEAFWWAGAWVSAYAVAAIALCLFVPAILVAPLARDPQVAAVAAGYLVFSAVALAPQGLAAVTCGFFEGMGRTASILAAALLQQGIVVAAALAVTWTGADLRTLWSVCAAGTAVQSGVGLMLLGRALAAEGLPGAIGIAALARFVRGHSPMQLARPQELITLSCECASGPCSCCAAQAKRDTSTPVIQGALADSRDRTRAGSTYLS